MNKTVATYLHSLLVAIVTAVAVWVSGVDISHLGGYSALVAGPVVAIISKALGSLIAKLS